MVRFIGCFIYGHIVEARKKRGQDVTLAVELLGERFMGLYPAFPWKATSGGEKL